MSKLEELIREVSRLEEVASPGPWTCYHRNGSLPEEPTTEDVVASVDDPNFDFLGSYVRGPKDTDRGIFTAVDALYIAKCRELVPLLIEEYRELKWRMDGLEK